MRLERMVALRYLFGGGGSFFFSVIALFSLVGIAVGVWALIVVLAVMDGFQREIREKLIDNTAHVTVQPRVTPGISGWRELARQLQETPGVRSVEPFFLGQGILRKGGELAGVQVRGILPVNPDGQPHHLARYVTNAVDRRTGIPFSAGRQEIIMSRTLAFQLGVAAGDYVDLVSPYGGVLTLEGFAPSVARCRVVALYKTGYHPIDSVQVYLHLPLAQQLFGAKDTVSGIALRGDDPMRAPILRDRLAARLPFIYYAATWADQNRGFFNALVMEKLIMRMFLTLIVLIAAFNIIATLIMMIMEKKRDIGVLLAAGLPPRRVTVIFLGVGLAIGLTGAAIGVIGGVTTVLYLNQALSGIENGINALIDLAARGYALVVPGFRGFEHVTLYTNKVYGLIEIPVQLDAQNVVVTAVIAVVLALAAAVYPAARAAALDPIEAINDR